MMDLTKEQHQIIKFYANLGKSVAETLIMIRQAFREESMSPVHALVQGRLKKARLVKSKVKSMLITVFNIKTSTKNLSWQAKQSIPYTTVTFYTDCVKMSEDFAPNFWHKRTGC
jgi:hypothetical protein